ncbi:hypothetical protein BJ138DRAFT_1142561 [Hygrophoropsis aurantiaca]|uniref:Uncharacterized protein n=1 Tax=Hygrophoropsis aurantiaca TaxID=72124 RepID=A0ACB8ANF7_9AGAM|nr:hypothetical protein BJ138DRAFT_1142561 [Hygrophoropsis aurantiaca]
MGLAGRKQKQKIPADPRNLSWSADAARFGQSYLSKLGWDPSQGLGASGDGMKSHLKVKQKLNMLGIGAGGVGAGDPEAIAWKQNKEFEAVLRRLNEAAKNEESGIEIEEDREGTAEEQTPTKAGSAVEDADESNVGGREKKRKRKDMEGEGEGEQDSKKKRKKEKREKKEKKEATEKTEKKKTKSKEARRASPTPGLAESPSQETPAVTKKITARPMAHRARFQASKRIAGKSAAAISEILGIAPTPSSSITPITQSSSATPTSTSDANLSLEKLTTSTKSVADYFKEKLGVKSKSSTGTVTPDGVTQIIESEYEAPRGGLGASRLGASPRDANNDQEVRSGIGSSSKASLLASFTTAKISTGFAAVTTNVLTRIPPPSASNIDSLVVEESHRTEETAPSAKSRREKDKKKRKDDMAVESEKDDNEHVKAEKKRKKHSSRTKVESEVDSKSVIEPEAISSTTSDPKPVSSSENRSHGTEEERKARKAEKRARKKALEMQGNP